MDPIVEKSQPVYYNQPQEGYFEYQEEGSNLIRENKDTRKGKSKKFKKQNNDLLQKTDSCDPIDHLNETKNINKHCTEASFNNWGEYLGGKLPIVNVEWNNSIFQALVDSGSTSNLISEDILTNVKLVRESGGSIQVKTLMGGQFEVTQKCKLKFLLGKQCFEERFNIVKNSLSPSFQIILGVPFLKNNNFCLDFMGNCLRNIKVVIPILSEKTGEMINHVTEQKINIYSKYKQIIPANSQKVIEVHTQCKHMIKSDNVFISSEIFPVLGSLLVSNAICINNNSKLFVSVINFGDRAIHVNKGSKLGIAEEIFSKFPGKKRVEFVNFAGAEEEIGKIDHTDLIWDTEIKLDHLSGELKDKVKQFLDKNDDVFAASVKDLPGCDTLIHNIKLTDNIPVQSVPYRVPYKLREELETQLNLLLESDIIAPSNSPYSSPVLLVKKADGSFRLAVDFRKLNKKIVKDTYPLPNITETIDSLAGAKIFSSLDLLSGFFQQKIDEEQQHVTSITTHKGSFFWKRTPFGLSSSPTQFQRLMNLVLGDLRNLNILIYIDDICIASENVESHFEKLSLVFNRLREHNLKLKPSKCHFFKNEITFLGFKVSNGEIQPINKNVAVIDKFKKPSTRKHVQSFLGCVGFYRRFISDFSKRAKTLINLTKDNNKFIWGEQAQAEFEDLKQALKELPSLRLPEINNPFILYTDASGTGLGTVLGQLDTEGFLRPVAFASRKLKDAETRYSATERELLALVFAINYFKCYLYSNNFTVYTDHAALTYTLKLKNSNARVGRWLCAIADYNFVVKFVKGKVNSVADFLSRFIEHEIVKEEIISNKEGSLAQPEGTKESLFTLQTCSEQKSSDVNNGEMENLYSESVNTQSGGEVYSNKFVNNASVSVNSSSVSKYICYHAILYEGQEQVCVNQDLGDRQQTNNENNLNLLISDNSQFLRDIQIAQAKDKHCLSILKTLSKDLPTSPKHLKFFINDNILKCKVINNNHTEEKSKIVLPKSLVPKIFSLAHESVSACHSGLFKTLHRIRSHFYWSGMYADVKKMIKSCVDCLEFRAHKPKALAELQRLEIPERPNQVVHADISGPFPIAHSGDKYILTIVDSFSKWCELYALSSTTSDSIAEKLLHFVSANGCPEILITDRGKNFLSEAIENVYKKLGIKHNKTSSYHPQSNSKAEKNHASVNAALTHLVNSSHNDWHLKLPFVMMALRSAVHVSTNETPFFIHTGRDMNLPLNLLTEKPKLSYNDYPSYAEQLVSSLRDVYNKVKCKLEEVAEKQENFRKKSAVNKNIIPGDLVMLYTPVVKPGLCRKFSKPNIGPFRVLEKTSPVNFKIQHVNNPKNIQHIHVDRLSKIFDKPTFPFWPEEVDEDPDRDVDKPSNKFQPQYNEELVKYAKRPRSCTRKVYWNSYLPSNTIKRSSHLPMPSNFCSNKTVKPGSVGIKPVNQVVSNVNNNLGVSGKEKGKKSQAISDNGKKPPRPNTTKRRKNGNKQSFLNQAGSSNVRHSYSLRSANKGNNVNKRDNFFYRNAYQFCE